jgi:hypothetical protein
MYAWKTRLLETTMFVLGRPEGVARLMVVTLLGLTALAVTMKVFLSAARQDNVEWGHHLMTALLGPIVIIAAYTAASLHLAPIIHSRAGDLAVLIGAPVLASLLITVPLIRLLLHTPYGETLLALLCGLIACMAVVLLTNAVFDSMRGGSRGFNRVRDRTHTIDNFIGK